MEKVIVFGTGRASEHFIKADLNHTLFEVVAFADNNPDKHGQYFFDKKILSPKEIKNIEYDSIIIASSFYDEISKDLIEKYDISSEKIHNRYYKQDIQIQKRYREYYKKFEMDDRKEILQKTLPEDEQIIVYTAITGGFDQLREPEIIDDNFKYVCFTDNNNFTSDIWDIRKIEIEDGDYNRTAKKIKVFPHIYFPDNSWSIWIDGQLQITGDLQKLVNKYIRKSNLLCFLHQVRTCIQEEAEVCKLLGHDDAMVIDRQLKYIMSTGYKDDNELIAGGFLVRQHNEPDVINLMNDWWEMIYAGSRRDQLSFNYVAWKNNFVFDITDLNIMDNEYIKRYSHKKIYKDKRRDNNEEK